jgi:hypothetical protein
MFQAKSLNEILQPKTSFDKTYIRFQDYITFCNLIYTIVGKIPKIVFFELEQDPPKQPYWETTNSGGLVNHFL